LILPRQQPALREFERPGSPGDTLDIASDLQAVQLVAGELQRRLSIWKIADTRPVGKGKEGAGHLLGIGETVGFLAGKYVPDSDKHLAGNGHGGFLFVETGGELLIFGDPMGMGGDGVVGGFHHDTPQVAPARLGDATGGVRHTAVMHFGAQTGIPDQLIGAGKAANIADGSQDGDGSDEANPGDLDQQRSSFVFRSQVLEAHLIRLDLGSGKLEGGKVGVHAVAFKGGDGKVIPPGAAFRGEDFHTGGSFDVFAVQKGMQTALGGGGETGHFVAVFHQAAQVAHFFRRDPDTRQQTRGVQLGKSESGFLVGLDLNPDDEGDKWRVDDGDGMHQGFEDVMNSIGVGGHLDDDCVPGSEVLPGPTIELVDGDLMGSEDGVELMIHTDGDEVFFMDVETDETIGSRIRLRHIHESSFRICWQTWPDRSDASFLGVTSHTDTSLGVGGNHCPSQVNGSERAAKHTTGLAFGGLSIRIPGLPYVTHPEATFPFVRRWELCFQTYRPARVGRPGWPVVIC
jgi:hypothetical protein